MTDDAPAEPTPEAEGTPAATAAETGAPAGATGAEAVAPAPSGSQADAGPAAGADKGAAGTAATAAGAAAGTADTAAEAADIAAAAAAEAGFAEDDDDQSALGVLANRNFLILWLSQVATQVGGNTVLYGLTVLISDASGGSSSAVSVLLLSFLAPAVLFGAVAGVFVDRFDRRGVLVATSLIRGLLFVLVAVFHTNVVVILGLNVLISIATTFFAPAELSMIPRVVPRDQLTAANGIFTLTVNAAFALGFTLLGPLLTKVANPTVLILIVAGLYVVSAALCRTLPAAPPAATAKAGVHEAEEAMGSVVAQLREGIAYIRKDASAGWALLYLSTAASIIGVLGVLGPAFARNLLHLKSDDFVVVVLPLGFGVVFGALLVNSIRTIIPRRRLIEIGLIVVGICLALITVAGPISDFILNLSKAQPVFDASSAVSVVTVVIAIAAVAGVGYAAIAIPAQTELQEELPTEVRGRVFGVLNTLVSVASFLPIIIVGPIADTIGVAPVVLTAALLVTSVGVLSMIVRGPVGVRGAVRSALGSVRFRPSNGHAEIRVAAAPVAADPATPAAASTIVDGAVAADAATLPGANIAAEAHATDSHEAAEAPVAAEAPAAAEAPVAAEAHREIEVAATDAAATPAASRPEVAEALRSVSVGRAVDGPDVPGPSPDEP